MYERRQLWPGQGEPIGAGLSAVTIKATADNTAGALTSARRPGSGGSRARPLHRHYKLRDMFYFSRTLSVTVGDETLELDTGSFACVPPGTFSNMGDQPVRFLNFNTPGAWESYMRDLGDPLASGEATPKAIARIASRYDFEVV